jgi:hypothetical protein
MTDDLAVTELYNALLQAKELIRKHHGIGFDPQVEAHIWNIYDTRAPEMQSINQVINKYKTLNPATGESGK